MPATAGRLAPAPQASSSDRARGRIRGKRGLCMAMLLGPGKARSATRRPCAWIAQRHRQTVGEPWWLSRLDRRDLPAVFAALKHRSEEHTSELQSLMRISYAVFCLKKTKSAQIPQPT